MRSKRSLGHEWHVTLGRSVGAVGLQALESWGPRLANMHAGSLHLFTILHSTTLTTIHRITSCHKIPPYTIPCCKTPYSACYTLRTDPIQYKQTPYDRYRVHPYDTHSTQKMDWEAAVRNKRDALLACIPVHWRLSEVELRRAKAHIDVRTVLPVSLYSHFCTDSTD